MFLREQELTYHHLLPLERLLLTLNFYTEEPPLLTSHSSVLHSSLQSAGGVARHKATLVSGCQGGKCTDTCLCPEASAPGHLPLRNGCQPQPAEVCLLSEPSIAPTLGVVNFVDIEEGEQTIVFSGHCGASLAWGAISTQQSQH